ncbi:ATP-binding protein [Sneathiella aquimaris]|uniref:ATP-binding protein n=1 Tax=Sneathiella aquimaris TaxID=2599305 RepID=UPI00146F25BE|nr:ATP-binding protein [Sneathiella aquimaris]
MGLPKINKACVSLLFLSEEKEALAVLTDQLNDPAIDFSVTSPRDDQNIRAQISSMDLVFFHVGESDIDLSLRTFSKFRTLAPNAGFFFLDYAATPERAVRAMKMGVDDYIVLNSKFEGLAEQVGQSCLDCLLTMPAPKLASANNALMQTASPLNFKVREVVKAAGELAQCGSLHEVCTKLLEKLGSVLGATGGSFYLLEGDHLKQVHSLDPGHAPMKLSVPLEEGSIFEQVFRTGEPYLHTGGQAGNVYKTSGWEGYKADNMLVYPLAQKNGEMIGIFSLHGKRDMVFTKDDRDIVLILAAYSRETIRALYAQEKSVQTSDSLRLTFENINEGIVLLNADLEIVEFNQKALTLTNIPADLLHTGQKIEVIYDYLFERGDVADRMQGKCPWVEVTEDFEYLHRCASGNMISVSGNYIENGGFVLTFTDITRQKEWEVQLCLAKERAEAASVSKTNFLASVSHELRTPLNAIIGFAEMINKSVFGKLENEKYVEYVHHIHDSGSHLLHLINNLLDLSKVEAGKFELQETDVHLSDLVQNTLNYCQKQADEAGVTLSFSEMVKVGLVRVDENAVRQILLNLLSNAIKFTPNGGAVDVVLNISTNGDVLLLVKDTGIGMEDKSLEIAMQPFGQIENAFNRKYPGTGLGLPLVASLVELHGGAFDISSRLGVGTTCSLNFPSNKAA